MKYEVTYSFNVRRFIKHTIEADTLEQAKQMARDQAVEKISTEINNHREQRRLRLSRRARCRGLHG